jgi:glycosyltransferase involved in cell wall biosynthesis
VHLLSQEDALESTAIARFERAYGNATFGSIVVIIPAYREAASIGGVLREIPESVEGHRITVLVIVDGDEDGTSAIATERGAHVSATGGHRGQGAALRLGYRLAVSHGASFLVSLDADGQYVPAEIPALLAPLLRGEADFVSGSRRLGSDGTTDRFRSLGVDVFAWIIGVLTGHRITDPAFGLRAMTADVARAVTLRQPQYQASELLIGTILHGFRVTERPATIRRRETNETRKGGNLLYGFRFGRVVLSTWWRDRGLAGRQSKR